jgi:hypothetical protein
VTCKRSGLRRPLVRRCTECTQPWGRASNDDFIIRLRKRCVALLHLVPLVSALDDTAFGLAMRPARTTRLLGLLGPCPRLDLRLSLVDEPHGATPILDALDRGLHERCGLGIVRPTPTQFHWAALAGCEQKQAEADEEQGEADELQGRRRRRQSECWR